MSNNAGSEAEMGAPDSEVVIRHLLAQIREMSLELAVFKAIVASNAEETPRPPSERGEHLDQPLPYFSGGNIG